MSGASAQDHSSGAVVRHLVIGRDLRDSNLHIDATGAYNDCTGTHAMHGLGASDGVVVGTAATQTLTNKTFTTPVVNGATLSGTITSTATVTGGTITGATITGLSSAGMVSSSATPKDYVDAILGSATAAATSAASAATSATAAATSASSAATSATAAATSAASALTSQTAAATSATSAATQATAATTSATSAAASATAAATSATSAAASATAADLSADAAEAAAAGAGAAGTAGAGTGAGVTASELALMGYGSELAPLVATPAEIAGTSSFAQGIKSLKDALNVGKMVGAPDALQPVINRALFTGATTGFDPEAMLRAGITGGISGFGDLALADLPSEVRDLVKSGVSTAVQGGNLEDVVKNAALGSIEKEVSSAITGTTGSKWAGEIATKTIKQVLTGGKLNPQNITAATLAQLAGRAVGAETGNNALGTAASQAVLGAIKGKDLETILKQSAMGALFTPAKKGG